MENKACPNKLIFEMQAPFFEHVRLGSSHMCDYPEADIEVRGVKIDDKS